MPSLVRPEMWLQGFCELWFMSRRIGKCQDGINCNLEVWKYCIVLCNSVPCQYPKGTANPRPSSPLRNRSLHDFIRQHRFRTSFLQNQLNFNWFIKFYVTFTAWLIKLQLYKLIRDHWYAQRIKTGVINNSCLIILTLAS